MDINNKQVSFDDEQLILVDTEDTIIGHEGKLACHLGKGRLHRAFSILLFNSRKELLIQKRSARKLLWGNYWSNSCCSHPRKGEDMETAVQRRLQEELGIQTHLHRLFDFEYQAAYEGIGTEHELCSVFIGRYDGQLSVNAGEIAAYKWISRQDLDLELETLGDKYTPWFKLEWQRINNKFQKELARLFDST